MQVVINEVITITDPTPELIKYVERELKFPNPEYAKKERLGFYTGNVPKFVYMYEVRGNKLILPSGCEDIVYEFFNNSDLKFDRKPIERLDFRSDVPLYDYQETAVDEMYFADSGILQAPAGSGKTQMGIALIGRLRLKALWLTHTVDLLNQSKDRALLYMDEDDLGTITGGKVNVGRVLTFATVQTMTKLDLTKFRDEWDVVIVDECHRVAGSPTTVTMFSRVLNSLNARHKYGLSATVHRADGLIKTTFALLGPVRYEVPKEEVESRVMQVGIYPVFTEKKPTDCFDTDGTLIYARMINSLTENVQRNRLIVEEMCRNYGRPSLILSDRLGHLEDMMSYLPADMYADAVMISGKMVSKKGKEERQKALDDMRSGKKKYLFATYRLAKEGLDIPCLERLYLTTPQKDSAIITQSVGRVARVCEGKDNPIVYDFVDDFDYLKRAYKKRWTTYRKCGCYEVV